MSKQKIINIDSRFRSSGTIEDFVYQITPIQAKQVMLVDCIFPNSWDNIEANNTFQILSQVAPGVNIDITIPRGILLNGEDIAVSLENQFLNDALRQIQVTFNDITGKFEFRDFSGAGGFIFSFPLDNMAAEILGFPKYYNAAGLIAPVANTIIAPNVAHIDGENYLLVASNMAVPFTNGNSHQGILGKISITEGGGDVIYYHNTDEILDIDQQLSNLNFRLTWWNNKVVDLAGRHWSLTLKIFYD
jgi:hypothetical protein